MPNINKSAMSLDSRYAGSGFKVDVYIKSVHKGVNLQSLYLQVQMPHINKLAMALDSRYAGSGFKVDVYIKSVHETLKPQS